MKLVHSFDHSIVQGTPLNFGLRQLLQQHLMQRNLQEKSRPPGVSTFEDTVLSGGLGARNIRVASMEYDAPLLHRIGELSARAGIAPPKKVLIYDHQTSNAAVLLNGSMAISSSLLRTMPPQETEAVIAHELSHLKRMNTNILTSAGALLTIATASIATFIKTAKFSKERGILKNTGRALLALPVAAIVGKIVDYLTAVPLAAYIRHNEIVADREAAELIGDPRTMASALQRLEEQHNTQYRHFLVERLDSQPPRNGSPGTVEKIRDAIRHSLRSHPSTYERIIRLREMERRYKEEGSFSRLQEDSPQFQSQRQSSYHPPANSYRERMQSQHDDYYDRGYSGERRF